MKREIPSRAIRKRGTTLRTRSQCRKRGTTLRTRSQFSKLSYQILSFKNIILRIEIANLKEKKRMKKS
jgi:lambda repressor-like predicted transcriptional regulator